MNTLTVKHEALVQRLPVRNQIRAAVTKTFLVALAVTLFAPFASVALADDTKLAPTTLESEPPPLVPFGIGSDAMHNRSLEEYKKWIPQMTAIGITVMRTPNCWWDEKVPGEFNWTTLDAQMDYLTSQNIIFGGLLLGDPKWNWADPSQKKGFGLSNNNVPAWSNYVTQLVTHAHGKIKYWEVWNEPPNGVGYDKTAKDYAEIVNASYDAVKAVDPKSLVGLTAKSNDVVYLDNVIKAGAKGHFDYIVLHPYEVLGTIMQVPGSESIFMHIAPTVRKMLAALEPSKVNAPIWFTELGFDAKKGADRPAKALVKVYTMGIAQGINCISWFEGMDGDSGPMGLMEANGTPRPAYTAMGTMIKLIGLHPTYLGWVLFNDKDYGFVFQGTKGTVLVTWARLGTTDKVDFGQVVSIVDPMTGDATQSSSATLTDAPMIVDGVPEAIVTKSKSNLAKPFPWDGDYTDAKSVSITFGTANVEKGLHTRSAAAVAADIVLYGGEARSGTVPGGNIFIVDPNFLSYTSTPIEIAAMVRLDDKNDPAQLELSYESSTFNPKSSIGTKKATSRVIPDNKEWHKITWRIDDAQFDNVWGYNFLFNSGKYVIQSVTVTKLDP